MQLLGKEILTIGVIKKCIQMRKWRGKQKSSACQYNRNREYRTRRNSSAILRQSLHYYSVKVMQCVRDPLLIEIKQIQASNVLASLLIAIIQVSRYFFHSKCKINYKGKVNSIKHFGFTVGRQNTRQVPKYITHLQEPLYSY